MKKEFYFMKNQLANKKHFAKRVFLSAAVLIMALFAHAQQEKAYKICSHNYVINSDFTNGTDNSTTVENWTFDPAPTDEANYEGWKQDNVLIYGKNLFIDKVGIQSATPALEGTPCPGKGKFVSFYYNSGNTGPFTFRVKLGDDVLGTFSPSGVEAQSYFTEDNTVVEKVTIYRHFFPSGSRPVGRPIWNNIWYEINLYVTDYQGGDLTFEYERHGGVSRQVRIDNVELRELIPTPEPKLMEVTTEDCATDTYDLTSLNPNDNRYNYVWYKDDAHKKKVDDATHAPVGTYYLYAEGCEQECVSYPSSIVKVGKPGYCCGVSFIKNSSFDNGLNDWSVTSTKPVYIQVVNGTNYRNSYVDGVEWGVKWVTPPAVDENWIRMYDSHLTETGVAGQPVELEQNIPNSCAYDPKKLDFDIVFNDAKNIAGRNFDVKVGGVKLFTLHVRTGLNKWRLKDIEKGVTIKITNKDNGHEYKDNHPLLIKEYKLIKAKLRTQKFHISVDIKGETAHKIPAGGVITFHGQSGVRYFLDNIELSNQPPIAEKPIDKYSLTPYKLDGETSCPEGTFNLHEAEPDVSSPTRPHTFVWYMDAAATRIVATPSKVPAGMYYMRTVSTCSGCESEDLIAFEVKQSCPKVSGTLFSNYDGGDFAKNEGTNGGGMFAHLVDESNNVVNVAEIAGDGTYSFFGKKGYGFKVIINKDKVEPKPRTRGTSGVLSTSILNANYRYAGTYGVAYPGKGVSKAFPLIASQEKNNVNFGVQSPPTASDITVSEPNQGAGEEHKINPLYSTDDDPNWNNGVGQTFMITELSTTKGTLYYNGSQVELNKEYVYNPDLLIFKPSSTEQAKLDFKYIYKDLAGAVSSNAGVVDYTFVKNTTVIDEAIQAGLHIYADGVGNVVVQNAGDEALDIQFFDLSGRLVVQRTVRDNELARIPMQANGMYIVKAVGSKINHTERVIVR